MPTWRYVLFALWAAPWLASVPAAAPPGPMDDPYLYDLRTAVFPVAFRAGLSQSHFGSALRLSADVTRRLELRVAGSVPWWNVAGERDEQGFALRAGVSLHVVDGVESVPLSGNVHPADAAAPSGRGTGSDRDLEVPTSSKLGSPRFFPPRDEPEGNAPVRQVHSVRLGYELFRAVERGRPNGLDSRERYLLNTAHALHLGYGWGTHWNLSPATAGSREVGWRHFYVDALLTLDELVDAKVLEPPMEGEREPLFLPVGVRIGMQGAIGALLPRTPGVGFAYDLELGALPGESGVEGYLFLGLGLALDFGLAAPP